MVDFSNRDEVKRWLDRIELPQWRREVAIVMAARAALRVTPLLGWVLTHGERERAEILSALVLPSLRSAATAWVAAKFPAHGDELRAAAAAAARVVYAVPALGGPVAAAAAAAAAADALGDTVVAAAVTAASAAAFAHTFADVAFGSDAANAADAFATDAALITSSHSPSQLAGSPLWANGAPKWATEAWRTFKADLLGSNKSWEVWTDWYEARLAGDAGHPPSEALEIARALISDDIWQQGPAVVNAEIKRLIAEHEGDADESSESESEIEAIADDREEQGDFEPILATRAALRVLPLLVNDEERIGDSAKSKFVVSIFRALAVAWARTQYSTLVDAKSSVAAARHVRQYRSGSGPAPVRVARAAEEAAFAAGSADQRVVASRARVAQIQTKGAIHAVSRDAAAAVIFDQANSSDRSDIVPGVRPDQIARVELWPGRDPPEFVGEQWEKLKIDLRFAGEGWDVWIDWYEARLDGRLRAEQVELAYVQFIRNVSPAAGKF